MNDYYKESFDLVNSFHPISESIFKEIYEFSELKRFKPNKKIIDLGDTPQKIYLIANGILRSYVILDNGKEITQTIFVSKMFFTSFKALVKKEPSESVYETVTECDIFEIDHSLLSKVYKKNLEMMTAYNKYLEFLIYKESDRYIDIISSNAKERYLALRNRIPEIDNIMAQYHIASYLGISPVQLSRIRAKLN